MRMPPAWCFIFLLLSFVSGELVLEENIFDGNPLRIENLEQSFLYNEYVMPEQDIMTRNTEPSHAGDVSDRNIKKENEVASSASEVMVKEVTPVQNEENNDAIETLSNFIEEESSSFFDNQNEKEVSPPGPISTSTSNPQLVTQVTWNSVAKTRRIQLSDLSEEQRRELLLHPPPMLGDKKMTAVVTHSSIPSSEVCTNQTLIDDYRELQSRYNALQQDFQKKQEMIMPLEEKLEMAYHNQSKLDIQLRLLQNELRMKEVQLENTKLKFEERTLSLEEKLRAAQKEVLKTNLLMKEQQQKYLLMMKHNCSYYCHQQLGVGSTDNNLSDESRGNLLPVEWNMNTVIIKPLMMLWDSFISFVTTNRLLEDRIVEGKDDTSQEISSPPSQLSSKLPVLHLPTLQSTSTIDLFLRSPLFLMEMIYYEYSYLWYLVRHAFPNRFPYLANEILQPLGVMIYSRLPLVFISNLYYGMTEKFSESEVVEDVINDLYFKWYQFLHLLENEDNIFYDFLERTFTRWNEEYLWQSYPFQALKALLPVPWQSYCEQYLLLGLLGIAAGLLLLWSYRILIGAALLMIFILVLPWLGLFYLGGKSLLLVLYCLNTIIISPFRYFFPSSSPSSSAASSKKKRKKPIEETKNSNHNTKPKTLVHIPSVKPEIPPFSPPPIDEADMI